MNARRSPRPPRSGRGHALAAGRGWRPPRPAPPPVAACPTRAGALRRAHTPRVRPLPRRRACWGSCRGPSNSWRSPPPGRCPPSWADAPTAVPGERHGLPPSRAPPLQQPVPDPRQSPPPAGPGATPAVTGRGSPIDRRAERPVRH